MENKDLDQWLDNQPEEPDTEIMELNKGKWFKMIVMIVLLASALAFLTAIAFLFQE